MRASAQDQLKLSLISTAGNSPLLTAMLISDKIWKWQWLPHCWTSTGRSSDHGQLTCCDLSHSHTSPADSREITNNCDLFFSMQLVIFTQTAAMRQRLLLFNLSEKPFFPSNTTPRFCESLSRSRVCMKKSTCKHAPVETSVTSLPVVVELLKNSS